MTGTAIINRKTVNSNLLIRKAQKREKQLKGRENRKPLKNYLGKVVTLASGDVSEASRISSFTGSISKEDLLEAIEGSGLTGMSGNGFPVYKKMSSFLSANTKDRILLINAVECDPALIHDEWLLKNRYAELSQTVICLMSVLSLNKAVFATKDKNVRADGEFPVAVVPPRYPMGEEHFLIKQVLGIHLERKDIPAEHGILVLNVQSIYQIGKIINNCYDGGRFVTIADLTMAQAKIAYIYPTDNVSNLLTAHFGNADEKTLYKGFGAMSCTKATETDDFSGNETFAAYANPPVFDNKNKCKRCGSCKRRCPMNIAASKVVRSVDGNRNPDYDPFQLKQCIRCGCCTYFCPAFKDVSGYIAQLLNEEKSVGGQS